LVTETVQQYINNSNS